jgi:glutathione reductase (NADPH)
MAREFDVIVIGTGVAGSTVAHKCRAAGWQVAIVDSRPFGGTCALRGCDPKKVLVGAADLVDWDRRMKGKGLGADAHIDWQELMRFKRTFTESVPEEREKGFADAGIEAFRGQAKFVDKDTLLVGKETLEGRYIVIAAGAKPVRLNIPGEEYLTTSTQFLDLDRLPRRIVFVGGGYISFEFAHVAARAGAQASILHRSDRPLAGFDPDLVEQLLETTQEIGVSVRLNAAVTEIERGTGRFVVHTSNREAGQSFEADMVVHGAGRVPEIDDLDLEAAGVECDRSGVLVNRYLQSISNPAVYAAGDAAASGLPLTPVGTLEGSIVAQNLLEGNQAEPDYRGTPTVVFTTPPLAAVGMQEGAARQLNLKFRVNHEDTSGWYTSRRVVLRHTGYKVLIEEPTERILGAHLLGAHAEEVINIFAMAIRFGIKAGDLRQMLFTYPTSSSDIKYML